MLSYEADSHYVQDEKGRLYLCPWGEFHETQAARAELMKRCIRDEANIDLHAYEGY